MVAETDPLGHTTYTEWDARGTDPLSVTDPLGHATRYTYDTDGNLLEARLADGTSAHATYNALRRPTTVTEPGGATWQHTYDDRGNLTASTDPSGATTHYRYTDEGHLTAVTDALGHTREITPNRAGLPTAVTDALGHTTHIDRDTFGRVTRITDPLGHTTRMTWSPEGRPLTREDPAGARESWTWDGEGNLLTHTDPAGHTTRHEPGPFDVPARRTDPDGAEYAFTYDTELRLTAVTNPQGLHWRYEYDAAGRLTSETDFNGATVTYTLDPAGRLTSRTNAAGQRLRYVRNARGNITEQHDEDADETTRYTYDASGELIRATSPDADLTLERDELGRIVTETTNGRTIRHTYDTLGRRTHRTTPSGLTSTWTYDAEDRPTRLETDHGSLTFTYDAAGREVERRTGEVTLTQTWDETSRLTAQSTRHGAPDGALLLQHRTYAYRPDGYLTEIRELTAGTRRFDLDKAGRVTTVRANGWRETYAYDPAGNLTGAEAPDHPSPGAREVEGTLLHRAGRTHYTYDAAGRRTSKTRHLLNGQKRTWTYTWNAQDRLTRMKAPDSEGEWTYTYDPLGRRTSKTSPDEASPSLLFTWDGTNLAEQTDATTGRTLTWDHAPGTHRPVTQTTHTPLTRQHPTDSLLTKLADPLTTTPRFHAVLTDLVGTPTELVAPDGTVPWQHRTTLWGTPFHDPPDPSRTTCPLRFPGQYADPESGLHYNYFRYYDPETASYLTPDPLGLAPAPNHHVYVHAPCTRIDPLGLKCEETGTVWDSVSPTQPNHPRSDIPKSFRLSAGGEEVWVHPNVTKHMLEHTQARVSEFASPGQVGLSTQAQMSSLHAAVAKATERGVPLNRQMTVGGWELEFRQRPDDALPALMHGRYVGE